MKAFILFILSILLSSVMHLNAENPDSTYHQLIDTTAYWNVQHYGYPTYTYGFSGDTTIDSTRYKKLYYMYAPEFNTDCTMFYVGAAREVVSEKKVYFRAKKYNGFKEQEILFYDFSLKKEDTIFYKKYDDLAIGYVDNGSRIENLIVDSIRYITINDQLRKEIYFKYPSSPYELEQKWIEGIGSTKGLIEIFYETAPHQRSDLLCYHRTDALVYKNSGYYDDTCYIGEYIGATDNHYKQDIRLIPNPAMDYVLIQGIKGLCSVYLYDLSGHLIKTKKQVSGPVQLYLEDLNRGAYIIRIIDNQKRIINKKLLLY